MRLGIAPAHARCQACSVLAICCGPGLFWFWGVTVGTLIALSIQQQHEAICQLRCHRGASRGHHTLGYHRFRRLPR